MPLIFKKKTEEKQKEKGIKPLFHNPAHRRIGMKEGGKKKLLFWDGYPGKRKIKKGITKMSACYDRLTFLKENSADNDRRNLAGVLFGCRGSFGCRGRSGSGST
jgi:hypothetical protein